MKQKILLLLFVLLGAVQTLSAKESYYVVSNGCRTVTLYYDDNKESRKGMDLAGFATEYQDMYRYSVATAEVKLVDNSSGKFEAADVNEDGRVTVTDAVTVVGLILEQGSESE